MVSLVVHLNFKLYDCPEALLTPAVALKLNGPYLTSLVANSYTNSYTTLKETTGGEFRVLTVDEHCQANLHRVLLSRHLHHQSPPPPRQELFPSLIVLGRLNDGLSLSVFFQCFAFWMPISARPEDAELSCEIQYFGIREVHECRSRAPETNAQKQL